MAQMLLGFVERLGMRPGPGARLRPLFQSSSDKSGWSSIEEDFPNSGVVSWWERIPDASIYKAWIFQVELSPTFDPANEHHDYYRVKGIPSPAVELIEVPQATDLEELRCFLLHEGLPIRLCASKRIVFRDRSGAIVGPLELVIREERFFLDEEHLEAPIPLHHPDGDLALANWEGHRFLPLEGWQRKSGEVDYSPDMVFLKRVIRDIRNVSPPLIEKAKLTDKLIGGYCSAIEQTSLTPLKNQRLKRLHKLAEQSAIGLSLLEDAIPDLLSLTPVKDALAKAGEDAARIAVEERRSQLEELEGRRAGLENEISGLQARSERLWEEIDSLEKRQAATISSFDERLQKKFQDITRDASSFLADVAVVRAAMAMPLQKLQVGLGFEELIEPPDVTPLPATKVATSICENFDRAGMGARLPIELLASWTAGYVPMVYGAKAREAFNIASESLFGGKLYFGTLGPTLASATDLMKLTTSSRFGMSSIEEFVSAASCSSGLFLLVFDNITLCQLDSTLVPLLHGYTTLHGQTISSRISSRYPTPAGFWPSNILLAGIVVDSPFALPMSRELWTCSTLIDTSKTGTSPKRKGTIANQETSALLYETWVEWLGTVEETASSEGLLLATQIAREFETSSLSNRMLRRLATTIDKIGSTMSEQKRAGILAEMAILPYLLSRGLDPNVVLRDTPADLFLEEDLVKRAMILFQKWGVYLG